MHYSRNSLRNQPQAVCINSRITCLKVFLVFGCLIINFIIYKIVVLTSLPKQQKANSTNVRTENGTLKLSQAFLRNKSSELPPESGDVKLGQIAPLKEPVTNPHDYLYVVTPNVTCTGHVIELVMCVPISRSNFDGRDTIRKTWGSYARKNNNSILIFFIGSELDMRSEIQLKIMNESKQFGDILQETYIDHYNNLSLKSVSILKWVTLQCPNAVFVLKADDDMYINVPLLLETLRSQAASTNSPRAFVMGSVQYGARPIRNSDSKWFTSYEMYKEDIYPNYVSGTAYAMTSVAASLLFEASLRLPTFWLEDIYVTGLCARKADVTVLNNHLFTYQKPPASGCSFRNQISGHRYSLEEILYIHTALYDPDTVCERAND